MAKLGAAAQDEGSYADAVRALKREQAPPMFDPGQMAQMAAGHSRPDVNQNMQLMMLDVMSQMRENRGDTGGDISAGAGRAVRRLQVTQERVMKHPRAIIGEYVSERS